MAQLIEVMVFATKIGSAALFVSHFWKLKIF